MSHGLIIGMTESGKTTLAQKMAQEFMDKGYAVLVLDPLKDPRWKCTFITSDMNEFKDMARRSKRCFLFIDESGDSCGQWEKENYWFATQSRHWGHSVYFIAQRVQMIATTIRTQCSFLYLFNCGKTDCKLLADEWNKPELLGANVLKQGEFFYCNRFTNTRKLSIFLDKEG